VHTSFVPFSVAASDAERGEPLCARVLDRAFHLRERHDAVLRVGARQSRERGGIRGGARARVEALREPKHGKHGCGDDGHRERARRETHRVRRVQRAG
jgi:hypothetical protein